MEVDRTHPAKATQQYHTPGFDLESARKEKERQTKKHLEEGPRGGHPKDGSHLEGARNIGAGPGTLAGSC